MAQNTAKLCLTICSRNPAYGVHTLNTAAKVLSELQAGKQDRDVSVSWKLADPSCGSEGQIVLCGSVAYRSQWQLQAYSDYIQKQICDMIDSRKVDFRLTMGSCQDNGG